MGRYLKVMPLGLRGDWDTFIIKAKGGIFLKIKLEVCEDRRPEVERVLRQCGLEIAEDAELVLCENRRYPDRLLVRDPLSQERLLLEVEQIQLIESFGHTVEVHTRDRCYQVSDRLYKLAELLDPQRFLRVSNSVIIACGKVRSIGPTFSMKFILTMENGRKVDVTRSYYYIFKEHFGI